MRDKIDSFINSFSFTQFISAVIAAIIAIFLWQSNEIQQFRVEQEVARVKMEEIQNAKLNAPATDWLEVKDVFVPNFAVGEDPIIVVDRKIKKEFTGVWMVEVELITKEGSVFYCSGRGKNHYGTDNLLPSELRLSWWMGSAEGEICEGRKLKPGSYRLNSYWTIYPAEPGYIDNKRLSFRSNVFTVVE